MRSVTAILAGPGTGKTTRLVEILCQKVMGDHVDPGSIACVTFSRTAASNIRDRALQAASGNLKMGVIWYGTTHALALAIVNEGHKCLRLPSRVTLYDDDDLKDLCAAVSEGGRFGKVAKTKLHKCVKAPVGSGDFKPEIRRAAEHVKYQMSRAGVVTYDDLLRLAEKALRKDVELCKRWEYRCRTLLVDEAHDISAEESYLYAALGSEVLIAVGDVNQAIYGWRGGNSNWLLDLSGQGEVEHLSKSWRCGQEICDTANRLIEHNPPNGAEKLTAAAESPATVETLVADTTTADLVLDLLSSKTGTRAIICRTNRAAELWSTCLQALGLEVSLVTSPRATWSDPSARALWLALRAAANPFDPVAEASVFDTWAYPLQAINRARRAGVENDRSPLENLEWVGLDSAISAVALAELVEHKVYRSDAFVEAADAIYKWSRATALTSPLDLITDLNHILTATVSADPASVTVITAHMAKGLEWDHVLIPDLKRGHTGYPVPWSNDMDEERRVLYVALTRARTSLTLIRPPERAPSMFWAECTGETIETEAAASASTGERS